VNFRFIPESEAIRTGAKTSPQLTLPAVRALAIEAGVLLLVCAVSAVAIVVVALYINALAAQSLPDIAPALLILSALGALELVCTMLIWRVFIVSRRRFSRRLQAVTGGLNDRIFLAEPNGASFAVLSDTGWTPAPPDDLLSSVHPEDRHRWPVGPIVEAQMIEVRLSAREDEWRWHRLRATPVRDAGGAPREWVGTLRDIHDEKLAEDHREMVIGELRHRLKNLLTVINALAKNSQRRETMEPGVEAYLQRFLGRLQALGTAGDLLLAGDHVSIPADALVDATLAPFKGENTQRFRVTGPPLLLREELAGALGLAVHELATNALKYGALSVPDGTVSLVWSITPTRETDEIAFEWKERGGPKPVPPAKPGFGTRMIKHVAAREKSGRVDIDYQPDGLFCRIAFARDKAAASAIPEPVSAS
jgi:two-component sensor histidine kinase/PAS domain-containing protein